LLSSYRIRFETKLKFNLYGLGIADALEGSVLQEAERNDLGLARHIADLIQEDRATLAASNQPMC
jgi:hypothetical protein